VQVDLLDRLVIIRTLPYSLEEAVQILAVRAEVCGMPPTCRLTSRHKIVWCRPCPSCISCIMSLANV